MHHFNAEIDWEVWALPLSVGRPWGQWIIRIGPLCMTWWNRDLDAEEARN